MKEKKQDKVVKKFDELLNGKFKNAKIVLQLF